MDEKELTPAEKGKITRERNAAKKAEARAAQDAEEKVDRENAKAAMRAILSDDRATPGERLEALKILDGLTSSRLVPYSVTHKDGAGLTTEDFKAEFAAKYPNLAK